MDFFAPFLARLGGPRRAAILGLGILAAAAVLAVSRWASQPNWVTAFPGLPPETIGQMADKLDQASIPYRYDQGGTSILVAESDLAKAKVAVAKGGTPGGGRPGLELFDQPAWGMTDYTQRINYRRALEGELERTIGKMSDVQSAQVHLVIHETDAFGSATQPSEASVVLKTRTEPSDDVVQGIAHLVSSSVEGLTSDHVTIVDDAGHLLSQAEEPNSPEGLTSRQLAIQRQIEDYLRGKAERILGEVVGPSDLRVQVSAAMDFDQIQRTTASVDPDKQAVSAETQAKVIPGAQGGAGTSNTSTYFDQTRTTESFTAAPGAIKRLTVAVLVADKNTGTATKPQTTPRPQAELDKIQSLVRSAVGADSARGDVVTVVSVPFAPTIIAAAATAGPGFVATVEAVQRPTFGILGIIAAFLLAFLAIRAFQRTAPPRSPVLALPAAEIPAIPLPAMPMPRNGIRDRVQTSIEGQPDAAARVVRAWLKEG